MCEEALSSPYTPFFLFFCVCGEGEGEEASCMAPFPLLFAHPFLLELVYPGMGWSEEKGESYLY